MKIGEERKRRRLVKRVLAGELTLARLRVLTGGAKEQPPTEKVPRRGKTRAGQLVAARAADDALVDTRARLADAVEDLVELLRQPEIMGQIPEINRANFAKHLTITKLKIENAIAIIRAGAPYEDEAGSA
jgi:hypothetical protein